MPRVQLPAVTPKRRAWNKGCLVGQKRPLLPKQVWAIRARLELAGNLRDLALFNVAIDVLNAAKASIAKLASAATFGFDIAGDLFSVQKLRLSGPLVAGLSKNAVGGEINFKFAGQERSKTATLDLDSLAATLFAQLQEAFYELANVQKWAQAAWNNVANVVTITVNEAKSWAENNIPQIG